MIRLHLVFILCFYDTVFIFLAGAISFCCRLHIFYNNTRVFQHLCELVMECVLGYTDTCFCTLTLVYIYVYLCVDIQVCVCVSDVWTGVSECLSVYTWMMYTKFCWKVIIVILIYVFFMHFIFNIYGKQCICVTVWMRKYILFPGKITCIFPRVLVIFPYRISPRENILLLYRENIR